MELPSQLPDGVYLPQRAWRTTFTEVVLLCEWQENYFTLAFTPEALQDNSQASQNRFRREGTIAPTLCFWPKERVELLLQHMEQREFVELPAQDFRIVEKQGHSVVIGKEKSLGS